MNTEKHDLQPESGLALKMAAATFFRFILNTARRFVYPFAPALSRGIGMPLASIASLIAICQGTSILGIISGPAADRWGYRIMMLAGLTLFAVGFLSIGCVPTYSVLLIGLILLGLGRMIFESAITAYVSERIPFNRRGTMISILEFNFAVSTLVGIPLIGFLIDQHGWRAPFFALGGLGLIGILILSVLLNNDNMRFNGRENPVGFRASWTRLRHQRPALGALGATLLFMVANDNLFIVYGAWFETQFELSVVAVGLGTIAIGLSEFSGDIIAAGLGDRLGLKRSVIAGMTLTAISYGLLPLWGHTISLAICGLFFIFLSFEFTGCCLTALSTELLPELRATMMSSFYAAIGIGRLIGTLIGAYAWFEGGIVAISLVSVVFACLAVASLTWGLKNWRYV